MQTEAIVKKILHNWGPVVPSVREVKQWCINGGTEIRDLMELSAIAVPFPIAAISLQESQGFSSCDFSGYAFKALNQDSTLAFRFLQ